MNINTKAHREKVREFCKSAGKLLGTKSETLIEKDIYLTLILKELKNTKLHENLVFKGGTCLAKAYLDYHRFSEDLDFIRKDQQIFREKSTNQIRKICSGLINGIGGELVKISAKYGFDFKFEKHNREYVQLGGSNKLVTFIVWFDSIYHRRSMIKVQINFLEDLEFPLELRELKPLTRKFPESEEIYFRDFLEFYKDLNYQVYNIQEIACEKIRTLLTRRRAKTRDILDLYLISEKFDINILNLKDRWIEKTKFALKTYEKYKENFNARKALTKEELMSDEINYLLLTGTNKDSFELFIDDFLNILNNETNTLFNKQQTP